MVSKMFNEGPGLRQVYLASSSTLVLSLEAGEVGRVLDAVEDRSALNYSREDRTW